MINVTVCLFVSDHHNRFLTYEAVRLGECIMAPVYKPHIPVLLLTRLTFCNAFTVYEKSACIKL